MRNVRSDYHIRTLGIRLMTTQVAIAKAITETLLMRFELSRMDSRTSRMRLLRGQIGEALPPSARCCRLAKRR